MTAQANGGHGDLLLSVVDACNSCDSYEDGLYRVLRIVHSIGFARGRLWIVCPDDSNTESLLVLADHVEQEGEHVKYEKGKTSFRLATSHLYDEDGRRTGRAFEFVDYARSARIRDRLSAQFLGLAGRRTIELMIADRGVPYAVLAFDWVVNESTDAFSSDVHTLPWSAMTGLLSLFVSTMRLDRIRRVSDALAPALHVESTQSLLGALASACGACIAAVFRYDWVDDTIVKDGEYISPAIAPRVRAEAGESPVERYTAGGPYLSGKAWARNDFRNVYSVDGLQNGHEGSMYSPSLSYHRALLGEIRSVLYLKVDSATRPTMFRLFNCTRPGGPRFSSFEQSVSREIVQILSVHQELSAVEGCYDSLRMFASRLLDPYTDAYRSLSLALGSAGVTNSILMLRRRRTAELAIECSGPRVEALTSLPDLPDGYLSDLFVREDGFYRCGVDGWPAALMLRELGYKSVRTFVRGTSDRRVCLVIPTAQEDLAKTSAPGALRHVGSLLDLLAESRETRS